MTGAAEDMIKTALAWMEAGRRVALVTVISTWGSSPRGVGSQLVVDEEGTFEGSVSGGCVESTLITEAQYTIHEAAPRVLSLGVTDDEAWDTGLACGGAIEVLVEDATPHRSLLKQVSERREAKKGVCVLTWMDSGEKHLLTGGSDLSADLPAELAAAARDALAGGVSRRVEVDGRPCFLHAILPDPQIVIVGAVHIAQPLAAMGLLLGYDVKIVDPREAFNTHERFPRTERIVQWPDKAFDEVTLHAQTALVALSHAPRLDDPALMAALDSDAFYIGALGSKTTHASRLARLTGAGYSPEALARIHGPVGLAIGSKTPGEIALSVMAEITRARRDPGHRRVAAGSAAGLDRTDSLQGLETAPPSPACRLSDLFD